MKSNTYPINTFNQLGYLIIFIMILGFCSIVSAQDQTGSPYISIPSAGSTLSGSSQTFSLNSQGITVENWYLRVGSSLGSNNIANRFAAGSSTSIPINNLPTDGTSIYIQLQYKYNGVWNNAGNYNYTSVDSLNLPSVTSPISGNILSGNTETFNFNKNGVNLTNWNLKVGTNVGSYDIANRFASGSTNSIPVSNLPTDSSVVYVRLQYKENGIWKVANDYTYTASGPINLPEISSPLSGNIFSGSTESFSVNNNGIPVTNWNLRVGSSLGSFDIANRFASGSANSIPVNNLPIDGSTVYVRLQYKESGSWKVAGDYNYTSTSQATLPLIASPVNGTTLPNSTEIFSLDNNGVNITNWNLRVGNTLGSSNIANRFAAGISASIKITNLPTDHSTIYVRLQYKENGIWKVAGDYTYIASQPIGYSETGPYHIIRYPTNGLTDNNYVIYYPQNAITADMPVVVFLEGGGSGPHIDDYQGAMEFFASKGYFVIGAESGGGYDSDYARTIVQSAIDTAIDAHGLTLSKFAIMGHSQGGGQAFYVMEYFQDPAHGGYGSDASLVISIDGWFAFSMNQADLAALQGDIAFIQMNNLVGTGTDPRIHLSIWNLASNTNKVFLTLPHNDHYYIEGNLNTLINQRQDILYQLGALTYDTFNQVNSGYTSIPSSQKATFTEVFDALMPENQYSADCEGIAYNARQGQLQFFDIDYCAMAQ